MTAGTPPRIPPQQIKSDIELIRSLSGINNYTPHNAANSLEAAMAALSRLNQSETALILAENALAAARSTLLSDRNALHQIALGVKDEAMVLFGPDSDQIVALGMKKKSDRNRPRRTTTPNDKG